MSKEAYFRGHWEWIAGQGIIIILVNLVLFTSTPLSKTLGEIFYLDLLIVFISFLGFAFHFRRLGKTYKEIRQTIEEGGDPGWLLSS